MNRMIVSLMVRASELSDATRNRTDDEGGVAAEYGVLLAGIVATVAIGAIALGGRIGDLFDAVLP
jgi:Flp pilus assembly pilin Flp